jgi:class 3 adenylate cyclase
MIACSNCGAHVREGAKFCSECGTPVALSCPSCSSPVTPDDKFCSECGHNLAGTTAPPVGPPQLAAAPPPAARPEERRYITALFIDLVGFTPLTESRDAEEVRGMLTRYFERAREIVARYGGTIDKFIGDAVMAVWGAERAHEDDAERGVRAAMDLVESVEELGDELGIPELRARAGVLSGEAAVGGDGNEGTGLIIGDIVNTASRLQGAAEPGSVLVGRSTMELARKSIEFAPAGFVELKGKSDAVETWRAVRVTAGSRGSTRSDGLVPPFVGRRDELRVLKDALQSVSRDSRVRLVSIIGQGGIGKSRLVDEFWNHTDGLNDTTYWHQGRSPAYGDGLSFWALAEMVRQRAGIAESDDDHRARTKLRTALAEYVSEAGDRDWIEPRLEALLGLTETPQGDRAELFAAWRLLFVKIAERSPVAMVFEDLHWADNGLLDFIDELISVATEHPILVVTAARPSLLDRRPGWGSDRTNTISLRLGPLPPNRMEELVRGVVADAPESLVSQLTGQAGGIPLYAVELLRMLHSRGLIEADDEGDYHIAGDVTDLEIPDSLHSLVGARLDQLDAEQRSLLHDAAVLGQTFTVQGLQAFRDATVDELADALQPLVRSEILSVIKDPRSPERGQYRFVQSIIREVAHQRISRAERLSRHIRVAEYYEELDEPALASVVAAHYLDALEVSPEGDQAEELRAKAISGLLAAADRAEALQSHSQVVSLCERGIELSRTPVERGELLIRAARSAHADLDERAEDYAKQAQQAFEEAEDRESTLRAATLRGVIYDDSRRGNRTIEVLTALVGDGDGDTEADAAAMGELARAYMMDMNHLESLVWADRALTMAERLDLVPIFTDVLITKGVGLGVMYRTREGLALLEKGLELAREYRLTKSKRRVLVNLGYIAGSDDWADQGRTNEAVADARRIGNPRDLAEVLVSQAWGLMWNLEWDEFDRVMEEVSGFDLSEDVQFDFDNSGLVRRAMAGDIEGYREGMKAQIARFQGKGDAQSAGNIEIEKLGLAMWTRQYESGFDLAMKIDMRTPFRIDLFWGLFAGLLLRDREKLEQMRAEIELSPFKGRVIDTLRETAYAALASLDGREGDAVEHWTTACRLADEVMPKGLAAMFWASAATYLGSDDGLGRERGRMAYVAWASVGAQWFIDSFADGIVRPEADHADEAVTA